MIPETNIDEYRSFTHKLILTSIGTIILSSALTQAVQGWLVPLSAGYVPAALLPFLEVVVGAYILFNANQNGTPKPTPKENRPPETSQTPFRSPEGGEVVYPPTAQQLEEVFMPKS